MRSPPIQSPISECEAARSGMEHGEGRWRHRSKAPLPNSISLQAKAQNGASPIRPKDRTRLRVSVIPDAANQRDHPGRIRGLDQVDQFRSLGRLGTTEEPLGKALPGRLGRGARIGLSISQFRPDGVRHRYRVVFAFSRSSTTPLSRLGSAISCKIGSGVFSLRSASRRTRTLTRGH